MTDHLTPKQELFCQKYVESGNASEAYREAYNTERMKPETVNREAFELLQNPKIAARVEELKARQLKRHDVTIERVVREFARLAFLDIRKAFDDEGRLKDIHELDEDTAAAIAGVEVESLFEGKGKDREIIGRLHKLKLSDKRAALDSLARYLGMFVDRSEVTLRKPIAEMTDAELDAEIAEYERTAGALLPRTTH